MKTTFDASITVVGEPKEALRKLQELLDHADAVFSYTTDAYSTEDGESGDTRELMNG